VGQVSFCVYPKARKLVEYGRDRAECAYGPCLKRRIDNIDIVKKEVAAWQKFRNNKNAKVNWQFTAEDARIKLRRLYPTLDS
jgi:hypothetical protein